MLHPGTFIPLAWQTTVLCGFRKLLLIMENSEHCLDGPAVIPRDNMKLSRTPSIVPQDYSTSSVVLCSFEQGYTGLAYLFLCASNVVQNPGQFYSPHAR